MVGMVAPKRLLAKLTEMEDVSVKVKKGVSTPVKGLNAVWQCCRRQRRSEDEAKDWRRYLRERLGREMTVEMTVEMVELRGWSCTLAPR